MCSIRLTVHCTHNRIWYRFLPCVQEYENTYNNQKTNFKNGCSSVFFSLLPVVVKGIFTMIVVTSSCSHSMLAVGCPPILVNYQVMCESGTQRSATVDYRQVSLFISSSILSVVVRCPLTQFPQSMCKVFVQCVDAIPRNMGCN